ncbi:MAG TPA: PucR family transcriptional regulator ligand-binding domain-containing protein [Symbiobacteriaceae bacterium]|nr:PucR family transcriptional regulator ligand-binding domain-containing protein [Symbiobacteriaceae bacterium]
MAGIKVREALQLPELANVTVVAGAAGLDRVINSVNVMEVPDISSYVESGQLLLTTTYPIASNAEALNRLVPLLAERGLAGLAVKPQRYIDEIPAIMIEQADAHDFPLLRLPSDASFTRLLNPIMSEVLHRQAALLQRSDYVHRSLTELVLQGAGMEELVRTVAELLALPVAVADNGFHILAYSEGPPQTRDPFTNFLAQMQEEGLYPGAGLPVQRSLWVEGRLSMVLLHPVQVGNEVYGYVCVWERGGEFSARDVACVEQAGIVTALAFQKQRAIRDISLRFRDDFIRDLLAGRVTTREEAQARASLFGFDLTVPRVLLLVRQDHDQEGELPVEGRVEFQRWVEQMLRFGARAAAEPCVIAHLGSMSVVLLTPRQPEAGAAKQEALELARHLAEAATADRHGSCFLLHIGIGQFHPDYMSWPAAYREAREALEIGGHAAAETVSHYDDLGVFRLLARVQETAELERFANDVLGELLEYDEKHASNLVETLTGFIRADGNLQQAAANLFVHYNTLRYRLQRISEIQGLRFDSVRDMAQADVALKAYRVLQSRRAGRTTPGSQAKAPV